MSKRGTKIEWAEEVWNPVIGCLPVSPGCLNCYAAKEAYRFQFNPNAKDYAPRDRVEIGTGPGDFRLEGVWCRCGGEIWVQDMWKRGKASKEWRWEAFCRKCKNCDCNGYSSLKSLREESPRFWGDHRTIRIAEVKGGRGGRAVFTGDVRTLEHRLTQPLHWKKPRVVFVNSMSDLFHEAVPVEFIDRVFAVMSMCPQHTFVVLTKRAERMVEWAKSCVDNRMARSCLKAADNFDFTTWPLPNVHLGVSVENQECADRRVPALVELSRMGWKTVISQEPQVGPVEYRDEWAKHIGGIICGGESGSNARPFDVAWARQTRDWCQRVGVKFFLKQLGAMPLSPDPLPMLANFSDGGRARRWPSLNRKGSDPAEWPADLCECQNPARLPWAMNTTTTEGSEA